MVDIGTRCTTKRVRAGNSPSKVIRAVFLLDGSIFIPTTTLWIYTRYEDSVIPMDDVLSPTNDD